MLGLASTSSSIGFLPLPVDINTCCQEANSQTLSTDLELNLAIDGMELTEAMAMRESGWKRRTLKRTTRNSLGSGPLRTCDLIRLLTY